MNLEHAALTYVGRRSNNEDSLLAEPSLGLFVVADGVGGYEGGEVASATVVAALRDFFAANAVDPQRTWPFAADRERTLSENLLGIGVRLAHREISVRREGKLSSMASTVAALYAADDVAVIAHCGDSRVYRLRDGHLERLTTDHSLYEQMVAKGVPDLPPLEHYPFKNIVTRVLGVDQAFADLRSEAIRAGDTFLLCSDGLHDPVDGPTLTALLSLDPAEACSRLVKEAYDRGGKDNITAVVLRAA
jgi:serine/threonine protein phosphatase PrpC